jgi:hypothetical protein
VGERDSPAERGGIDKEREIERERKEERAGPRYIERRRDS